MKEIIPGHRIENRILDIRGSKVMLDQHLAELYGVETKALNQAVRRNLERFPEDFMFQLTSAEAEALRSQIVTSRQGGRRYLPYAFSEHGVLMLSNVLRTPRAVSVSIQIIRVFARIRGMIQGYQELIERIRKIERRQNAESREIWKAVTLLQKALMK